jgi:hypothetical protein
MPTRGARGSFPAGEPELARKSFHRINSSFALRWLGHALKDFLDNARFVDRWGVAKR